MAIFSQVRMNLFQIRSKLTSQPVFLKNSGAAVDDPGYTKGVEELDSLRQQLLLLIRDLTSTQNRLAVQRSNIPPSVRGDDRRAMQWGLGQQQSEAADLMRQALDLQKLIEKLIRKNGTLTLNDGADNLSQMLGSTYANLTTGQQDAGIGQPWLDHVSQPHADVLPEHAILGVYVMLRVLIYLLTKGKK